METVLLETCGEQTTTEQIEIGSSNINHITLIIKNAYHAGKKITVIIEEIPICES